MTIEQYCLNLALKNKIPEFIIPSLSNDEITDIKKDKEFNKLYNKIYNKISKDKNYYTIFMDIKEIISHDDFDVEEDYSQKQDYSPMSFINQMTDDAVDLDSDEEVSFMTVIKHGMKRDEQIKVLYEFYKDKNFFSEEEKINIDDINLKGKFGRTKLHNAVLEDKIDEVKRLVEEKADFNIKDNNGHTALTLARLNGRKEITEYLKTL